jgi:hypothetical protein
MLDHVVSKGSDGKLWASGRPFGMRRGAWLNVIHSNQKPSLDDGVIQNLYRIEAVAFRTANRIVEVMGEAGIAPFLLAA